jgi:hypothetical protein
MLFLTSDFGLIGVEVDHQIVEAMTAALRVITLGTIVRLHSMLFRCFRTTKKAVRL